MESADTYISPAETELYYLQSRYYNPEIGRFINADGYVSTGTGLLGFNMYAYCNNNPVNCVDPRGCFPECFLDDCDITNDFDNGMCGGMGAGTYHYGVDLSYAVRSASFGNGLLNGGWSSYSYTTPVYGKGGSKSTSGFNNWLNKGPSDNKVYFGIKNGTPQYTGITKQTLGARLSQHNANGKGFQMLEEQFSGLTRNQARAIEQYYIQYGPNKMNQINSISLKHRYYQDAMDWAKQYLGVN